MRHCYLAQDAIVTTQTHDDAMVLHYLLKHWNYKEIKSIDLSLNVGYNKDTAWWIHYDYGTYDIEILESLERGRKELPLLPVYTFQGFKHHFIK